MANVSLNSYILLQIWGTNSHLQENCRLNIQAELLVMQTVLSWPILNHRSCIVSVIISFINTLRCVRQHSITCGILQ